MTDEQPDLMENLRKSLEAPEVDTDLDGPEPAADDESLLEGAYNTSDGVGSGPEDDESGDEDVVYNDGKDIADTEISDPGDNQRPESGIVPDFVED